MKVVSRKRLQEMEEAGAEVESHPKLIESPGLVDALRKMGEAQMEAQKHQSQMLIKSIDALARSINAKPVSPGTDLTELITAVLSLKQEASTMHEPVDYLMTAERDPQRHLIDVEKGIRFTAVRRTIN